MQEQFNTKRPLLHQLEARGLEFDQKMQCALELAASKPDLGEEDCGFPDSYLFLALYRMNTVLTRLVTLDESRLTNLFHEYRRAARCPPGEIIPGRRLCHLLNAVLQYPIEGSGIGVGHFLRALADVSLNEQAIDVGFFPATGRNVVHRTFSIETLLWGMGHHAWKPLEDAPDVREVLLRLKDCEPIEDIQYLLELQGDRIIFRPTSCLGDYSLRSESGLIVPTRAILTHFKEQYGGFTSDEIEELEALINNAISNESDIQRFFERHSHFFRRWDCRDVFPHVYLARRDEGPLVPDFILTNSELQKTVILDLKKPGAKIIRHQRNRDRFSASIMEARAQLFEYRDWFSESANRLQLAKTVGMEIFRPQLAVVIGRSSEFKPGIERQKLASTEPQLEIVTFDDITSYAKKRRMIIQPSKSNT